MGIGEMWAILPEALQTTITAVGVIGGIVGLMGLIGRLGPDKVRDQQDRDLRQHFGHGA